MSITSSDTLSLSERPPVAVPSPTGRNPWSRMLLREWAALKYPGVVLKEEFRLGPTSAELVGVHVTPELEAALRNQNWYADGLLVLPHEVLVIEAKVPPLPAAVGQVLFYQRLMYSTPVLQPALHLPMVAVVLFAAEDHKVTQFARLLGCRVEIHTPPWIADYLNKVWFRRRTTV